MTTDQETEKYLVPGLLRGLAILELYSDSKKALTLTEIAESLDINRSSAFRLVQTLEYAGYLKKGAQKSYTLDSKVMQLGYLTLSHMSLPEVSQPIMQQLRDKTTLATHLAVLNHRDLVYVSNEQALGTFTSNIQTGARWPAYATVIGQILLSALDENEIRALFHNFQEWQAYSSITPTNIEELLTRIAFVREQEYLISWGKFRSDMAACAVPIINRRTHKPIAALSVSCPLNMFEKEEFITKIVPCVIEAANQISDYFY
ncbi:IclR family transcriptional regulator [Vitreoscilla massiliensis]|uniref:IclR family transcriptional regulator n=1 Tax=Vitreoscilla massiliensis TaxID=1689272 RepID=A0ABY4E396_9NEIS|nr:IclR family transcriptional regulator [Vitreoscilla massiliensis]UOO89749.1 IclR family transcriptional regulator [Vitreoscilla massiliensis]